MGSIGAVDQGAEDGAGSGALLALDYRQALADEAILGKDYGNSCAFAFDTVNVQAAPVHVDDFVGDGKPQTDTVEGAHLTAFHTAKGFADEIKVFFRVIKFSTP